MMTAPAEQDAPELPSQLQYGELIWNVIALDTDTSGDADDLPDVVPINGRALVTANVDGMALLAQELPMPLTILLKPTPLIIENGRLIDRAGHRVVKLLGNDSPGLGTQIGWSYTITYELDDGYTFGSFSFNLPAGSRKDLTDQVPLSEPSPGVVITKGPPGPPGEAYGGGIVLGPVSPGGDVTDVVIVSRWGLRDDGSMYYDEDGALPDEAALLIPDVATGGFTLHRPGMPFTPAFVPASRFAFGPARPINPNPGTIYFPTPV